MSQAHAGHVTRLLGGAAGVGLGGIRLLLPARGDAGRFTVTPITTTTTPIPNGAGTFLNFGVLSLANGPVAFFGIDSSGRRGIDLTTQGGGLRVVADATYPVPHGAGTSASFEASSLHKGQVACSGFGSPGSVGIDLTRGSALETVMDQHETRDGQIPSGVNPFLLGCEGLSGDSLAFQGRFAEGTAIGRADAEITVTIAVKPGSHPNPINPRSQGQLPVAILTTATCDASAVDPSTVRFGATGTEAAPVRVAVEDGDGRPDL